MAKMNLPFGENGGLDLTDELKKYNELYFKADRSTSGQESYTSTTSAIVYSTADYPDNADIYGKGEVGLIHLFQLLYGGADGCLLMAEDFNELGTRFSQYLSKENTEAYTPTAPYHPATVQYVLSAVPSAVVQVDASGNLPLVANRYINCINTSDIVLTVPAGELALSSEIYIARGGTGGVSLAAGEGVTIGSVDGKLSIAGQYGLAALKRVGSNQWHLHGALE